MLFYGLNEQLLPIKGRVDLLFAFYKGNLRLIKAINLHGNSSFWNFPHPYKFASQLSCSQTYALFPFLVIGFKGKAE